MTMSTDGAQPRRRHLGLALGALTGLQIAASLGLQGYVIAGLGAGVETDAFYAGSVMSQLITGVAIDNLPAALIPLLAACSPAEQRASAWSLCAAALLGFTALALVLSVAAPLLARLLVPGFSSEGQALTAMLTRIHLLSLGGTACTAVISSVCQVRGRFIWPPVAALASALAAWALVVWTIDRGVMMAAWAQVLAFSLPAVLLLPALGMPSRHGWRPQILAEVSRRVRPLMLTRAYFLMGAPFDRLLLSFLPAGSLVLFEAVSRVFSAIQRVLVQGVVVPLLPELSRLAQAREWPAFRLATRRRTAGLFGLGVLAVAGLEVGALGALVWLDGSSGDVIGRISGGDLRQIAWLVALMAGILPTQVAINALSGAYYAQGDTTSPSRIAAVSFTIGTALKALGFWLWGIEGLAVGVTAWSALHCVALALALARDTARRGPQDDLVVA